MPASKAKRKIARWKISDLRPHPRQAELFPPASPEELQELADDIQANSLVQPVEITVDGVIVCGHQRVEAARLLGWEEVRCWVRLDLDSDAAIEQRLIEDNLHRRQLGKLNVARCYKRLKQLPGANGKQRGAGDFRDVLGKRFRVTGRTLDRWAKLLDGPIALQQAFDDGKVTLAQASVVAGLPAKKQQAVIQGILGGTDPKQLLRGHAGGKQPPQPDLEAEFARLLRSLERNVDALEGQDLPSELQTYPGAVSILRRSHQLIGRIVAAIDGPASAAPIPRSPRPRPRRQQGAI